MTKTEVKALGVDELRDLLSEHFDGITEDTTKKQLHKIVDDNWDDFLDAELNPVEEVPVKPGLDAPNPATDLFSGRIRR